MNSTNQELMDLFHQTKNIAKRHRQLTGQPLSIGNAIAFYEAARLLGLTLAPEPATGYDMIRETPAGIERLQVKSRVLSSPKLLGGLMGALDSRHEWDAVLLVLMDQNFETLKIFEAPRTSIIDAHLPNSSRSPAERGALSVSLFCSPPFSRQVWPIK